MFIVLYMMLVDDYLAGPQEPQQFYHLMPIFTPLECNWCREIICTTMMRDKYHLRKHQQSRRCKQRHARQAEAQEHAVADLAHLTLCRPSISTITTSHHMTMTAAKNNPTRGSLENAQLSLQSQHFIADTDSQTHSTSTAIFVATS